MSTETSRTPSARTPSAWARATGALRTRWQGLPRWARAVAWVLVVAFVLALPSIPGLGAIMAPGSSWERILFYPIAILVLLALGLNVVVGYAGLLDLGFVAFFAIGAYTNAILGARYGWSFWEVLPVGIGLAMFAGLLLGSPTLRLRGDYLAIVTLGFGEIIRVTANNTEFLGGPRGINDIPRPPSVEGVPFLTYSISDSKPYYYLAVAFIVLFILVLKRLEHSRVGRSWTAIREDEDAAELMGVPTLRFKLWAFTVGAAVGGSAGVLYASFQTAIRPTDFTFIVSATILAAVVLGGAGHIPGVVLGAFLVAWIPEVARGLSEYRVLFFGAALVLLMVFRPQGLWPSRVRKAELLHGEGGLGKLGAEVPSAEQEQR
jgi:branched-chain amino acid transport system permease protein